MNKNKILTVLRCALADLEGVMPEIEPSGDRTHPGWKTIDELKDAIKGAEASMSLNLYHLKIPKYPAPCGTFHEAVRAAESEEAARQPPTRKAEQERCHFSWPPMMHLDEITVTHVGTADASVEAGFQAFEYNAE